MLYQVAINGHRPGGEAVKCYARRGKGSSGVNEERHAGDEDIARGNMPKAKRARKR